MSTVNRSIVLRTNIETEGNNTTAVYCPMFLQEDFPSQSPESGLAELINQPTRENIPVVLPPEVEVAGSCSDLG